MNINEINEAYKSSIEVMVNLCLADQFIEKIRLESDCKIINVREWISGQLLQYYIECPDHKREYILELGFMTFVSNPEFQKYYE